MCDVRGPPVMSQCHSVIMTQSQWQCHSVTVSHAWTPCRPQCDQGWRLSWAGKSGWMLPCFCLGCQSSHKLPRPGRSRFEATGSTGNTNCAPLESHGKGACAEYVVHHACHSVEMGVCWQSKNRAGPCACTCPPRGLCRPEMLCQHHICHGQQPGRRGDVHDGRRQAAGRMREGSRRSAARTRQHEQEEYCSALEVELQEIRQALAWQRAEEARAGEDEEMARAAEVEREQRRHQVPGWCGSLPPSLPLAPRYCLLLLTTSLFSPPPSACMHRA